MNEKFGDSSKECLEPQMAEAADMLKTEIDHVLYDMRSSEKLKKSKNVSLYVDRYKEKIIGHERHCTLSVRGREVKVSDITYDAPYTGEAKSAFFIGGSELLMDRSGQGAEGPFGILLFLDEKNDEVESVQAKYFQDDATSDMPAEYIQDVALVMHQKRQTG